MKVVDPQSALLTTAEVHQFLKDNPVRQADKKIGAYAGVNLSNYNQIRTDIASYVNLAHPAVTRYPPVSEYMKNLLIRLKPYGLTKTEVFTLINLEVGFSNQDQGITNPDTETETNGDADEEAGPSESDLPKSLFRLVVEESDQRFEGDEGEQKIDEILVILRESIRASGHSDSVVNGHGSTNGADRTDVSMTD